MSEPRNIIEERLKIRNYQTDFAQKLRPSAILGLFQEIAAEHSEEMGFGHSVLKKNGMFWVLSKMYVQIEVLPSYTDEITVKTWPHSPNKAIFERSFSVEDNEGRRLISAFSRWCILSGGGRIVPASRVPCGVSRFVEERSVTFEDWIVPDIAEKTMPAFSLKIANSEYDLNQHVNNIKYADYIFNCFSVAELSAMRLKNFQIHYVKQSHENDVLDFYRREISAGVFVVEGVKNAAETVVTAKITFGV